MPRHTINLWEHARGDGRTDDTEALRAVIARAARLGGARIACGGKDKVYLIAGREATYGEFKGVGGPFAFKRGIIELQSNLHFVGDGARFVLGGGRHEPCGLFYHPFWEGSTIENVSFTGIELDGNVAQQHVTPKPAGTHDNDVWQHGHAIACARARHWRFERCTIHGFRGAAINLDGSDFRIRHCTFYDNFSHDIGGAQNQSEIAYNTFRDGVADSRWVAAIDIEKLEAAAPIIGVHIHHNVFDFRKGYGPTERTPQFASDSAEAHALRRHYRRAVTFSFFYGGFDNNVYNGTMHDIAFTDNAVYQGSVDAFNWCDVDISRNTFLSTYEDLTGLVLANVNAITVSQAPNGNSDTPHVVGLAGATIRDNRISHDIDGAGILVDRYAKIDVGGGYIKNVRGAGVRLNGCSGTVSDIAVTNIGKDDARLPPDRVGEFSSAVVVFGSTDAPLTISGIEAGDTREGPARRTRHVVYANVAVDPRTTISHCTGDNLIGAAVRDVNRTTRQTEVALRPSGCNMLRSFQAMLRL